jgi:hypothetical protein
MARRNKRMTLVYQGQKIDFSGGRDQKIFNDKAQAWIDSPVDFCSSVKFNVAGMDVDVIGAADLIDYKRYLSGQHQKEDIAAVKKYLDNE